MIKLSISEAVISIAEMAAGIESAGIQPGPEVAELAEEIRVWLNQKHVSNSTSFLAVLTWLASHAHNGLTEIKKLQ